MNSLIFFEQVKSCEMTVKNISKFNYFNLKNENNINKNVIECKGLLPEFENFVLKIKTKGMTTMLSN